MSSSASSRRRSNGPGNCKAAGLFGRKAEAAVIGRIADQQHGAVAELARRRERAPHQSRADAEAAAIGGDRHRAEQERRPVRPAGRSTAARCRLRGRARPR